MYDAETSLLKTEIEQHIEVETLRDADMIKQIATLQTQVDSLSADVKTLIDLWTQAKGVVNFVKWAAWIGGILVSAALFIKDHYKG